MQITFVSINVAINSITTVSFSGPLIRSTPACFRGMCMATLDVSFLSFGSYQDRRQNNENQLHFTLNWSKRQRKTMQLIIKFKGYTIIDKKAAFLANAIQHTVTKLYFGKKWFSNLYSCLFTFHHAFSWFFSYSIGKSAVCLQFNYRSVYKKLCLMPDLFDQK